MTLTTPTFDLEAALTALREGKDLNGKDGILTPLIKQLTEAALKAELDAHLAAEAAPNRKNAHTLGSGLALTHHTVNSTGATTPTAA